MNDLSPIYILMAAFFLGLRHGAEWDHLAAIVDITASDISLNLAGTGILARGYHIGRAFWLSTCYGLGHSLVVIALGLTARSFASLFPHWFDSACERLVGVSLVLFSLWVFYVVYRSIALNEDTRVVSRAMLLYTGWQKLRRLSTRFLPPGQQSDSDPSENPSVKAPALVSFLIGMLHGLGVETGTQVIILSALGSSIGPSFAFSCAFLLSFILGLITTNSIIALCSAAGLKQTRFFKPLYLSSGILAGSFSLVIGTCLACGASESLQKISIPGPALPPVSMFSN